MKAISPTDMPALAFTKTQESQNYRSQSSKIGWIRALAPKPGMSFDLAIKDGLGRVKMQRQNCKTETTEYGELLNLPTNLGEDLQVEISNLKGSDKIHVFLN